MHWYGTMLDLRNILKYENVHSKARTKVNFFNIN